MLLLKIKERPEALKAPFLLPVIQGRLYLCLEKKKKWETNYLMCFLIHGCCGPHHAFLQPYKEQRARRRTPQGESRAARSRHPSTSSDASSLSLWTVLSGLLSPPLLFRLRSKDVRCPCWCPLAELLRRPSRFVRQAEVISAAFTHLGIECPRPHPGQLQVQE